MLDLLKQKIDAWLQGRMDNATNEYIQKYATDKSGAVDPKAEREIKVESERSKIITRSLYWDEPLMWAGVSATLGFLSGVFQRIVGNGNGKASESTQGKPEKSHFTIALQGAALASLSAATISLIRIPQRAEKSFRSRIESKMESQKLEALLTEQQANQISP